MKNKIIFGASIVLILMLGFVSSSETNFFVLGHVYPDYGALSSAIKIINEEKPDFVVFLGDNSENIPKRNWDNFLLLVDRINVPVYFVPGNHDIAIHEKDKKDFEEYFSKTPQVFSVEDNHFILLNSIEGIEKRDISREQVDFVESVFENVEGNKIIFMHHCLFYQDGGEFCNAQTSSSFEKNNWNQEIIPLIKENNLGVFVGDSGVREPYFSYIEEKVHYYGVGFGEKFLPHLLSVSIKGEVVEVVPILLQEDLSKIKYSGNGRGYDKSKILFGGIISVLLILIILLLIKIKNLKKN